MSTRPGYERAEASWLSKATIHRIGESVANQLQYKPGDDLHELVEEIGGRVDVEPTLLKDPEHTGSLYVNGLDDFEIIVPSHTSLVRDRFTIAHELGHYYLHYVWPRQNGKTVSEKLVALRRGSNRIEWEANWFAAAFLMPAKAFRVSFETRGGDMVAIASEFDVSIKAAEIRAQDLGV